MDDQIDFDLGAYLRGKGLDVHAAAGDEITVHCLFCPDGDPKGKGKLYLNTISGLWDCKRCGERGNARTLLAHFGDETDQQHLPGANPTARRAVLAETAAFCQEQLQARDEVLEWLVGRGEHPEWGTRRALSGETVLQRQLGWASSSWSIKAHLLDKGFHLADIRAAGLLNAQDQDFFRDKLMIPYQGHGHVVQMRGKQLGGKYLTGPGEAVRLYGAEDIRDAREVVITEGEFDRNVLLQALQLSPNARHRQIAVVGLPGASIFPAEWATYFAQAGKVYVALDPDDVGRKASIKIKETLGSRARIVELPEGEPKHDWTHLFSNEGWSYREASEALGNASGKRLFTFGEAARKWATSRATRGGLKTGFAAFDHTIHPGVLPGQLCVFLAKTGAGKTVLLSNLAYNMRDRPGIFVSLELTQEEVYNLLNRIYHFHHPFAGAAEMEQAFSKLRIVDENRLSEGDLTTLIEEYEEDTGDRPEWVSVDYLGYYARGMRGNGPYEKTSNAVMQLKAEAKKERVALFSPHQVNRNAKDGKPIDLDDARDSGVVEETADYLLSLYRPEDAVDNGADSTGKVHMRILKSRHGGKGTDIHLVMSHASLVLVDGTDMKKVRQVSQENSDFRSGLTYDAIRERQGRSQLTLVGEP